MKNSVKYEKNYVNAQTHGSWKLLSITVTRTRLLCWISSSLQSASRTCNEKNTIIISFFGEWETMTIAYRDSEEHFTHIHNAEGNTKSNQNQRTTHSTHSNNNKTATTAAATNKHAVEWQNIFSKFQLSCHCLGDLAFFYPGRMMK